MVGEFVVNTSSNPEIKQHVAMAFSEHGGQLPLEELLKSMGRFKFNPLLVLREDCREFQLFKKSGYDAYELRDGIVYIEP